MIDNLAAAGTESQLLMLIRGLDRDKIQPYLCLLDGTSEALQVFEPDDCPILRLGVRSFRHPNTLRQARQFVRFLRRERIDIVQTYFQDSTYFAIPLARLAGVTRIIRNRRDLGYWVRPIDRFLGRLYNWWLVTTTLANCEACRQAVIAQEGAKPGSVVVIGNGIEMSAFANLRPFEPLTDGRPGRIGMVANLRPVKAPDVFIRAAGSLRKTYLNCIFQMAGEGDRELVLTLARECGVDDRLELLGSVSDVPRFLEGLDVAVLTSHSEGLSNSLLEYMAAGRPIVATSVGGNIELIEDGVTGLLVPPNDPEAVATAIDRLLSDPVLAGRLANAAREYVLRDYSREIMTSRHAAMYYDLLAH